VLPYLHLLVDNTLCYLGCFFQILEFPTPSGILLENATQTCTDALTGAGFSDTCQTILEPEELTTSIENCISDIKVSAIFV